MPKLAVLRSFRPSGFVDGTMFGPPIGLLAHYAVSVGVPTKDQRLAHNRTTINPRNFGL
jgi:hypothetical protein